MPSMVCRLASEEVVITLLQAKCIPILLYGTEECPMFSRVKQLIEFLITRVMCSIQSLQLLLLNVNVISTSYLLITKLQSLQTSFYSVSLHLEICYAYYFLLTDQVRCIFCVQLTLTVYELLVNCII